MVIVEVLTVVLALALAGLMTAAMCLALLGIGMVRVVRSDHRG
jgi:hypothetical protein